MDVDHKVATLIKGGFIPVPTSFSVELSEGEGQAPLVLSIVNANLMGSGLIKCLMERNLTCALT